jgi:hypothetical protein
MKGKNLFISKRSPWEAWSFKIGGPDRAPRNGERIAGAESPPEVNSSGASIWADERGYFEALRGTSAACF